MIVDSVVNASCYYSLSKSFEIALKLLNQNSKLRENSGRYDIDGDSVFLLLQEYRTKQLREAKWEAHRKYVDIHFLLSGSEKIGYSHIKKLKTVKKYNSKDDYLLLAGSGNFFAFEKGYFAIFFPWDAHMPGLSQGKTEYVKKAVIKVKIS